MIYYEEFESELVKFLKNVLPRQPIKRTDGIVILLMDAISQLLLEILGKNEKNISLLFLRGCIEEYISHFFETLDYVKLSIYGDKTIKELNVSRIELRNFMEEKPIYIFSGYIYAHKDVQFWLKLTS